ncbi:ATP-binding protein [Dyella silvae]|uniref:sensor histidine kinase n=1 Tax=Dyella silvae TaxID=2994424 RepID=UPI002263D2C3|nr:ATP-binding protein [Dyella silvae]
MFAIAVAAQWLSLVLWDREGDAQMVWLAGPLLLGALISDAQRYWLFYDVGWFLGMLASCALLKLPLAGMVILGLADLLLIHLAAFALVRAGKGKAIDDFRRLIDFLVIAVVLLPLVAAGLIALLANMQSMPVWLSQDWWHVALADALGYALLPPVIMSLANPGSSLRRDALPAWNVLLGMGIVLAVIWLAWRELGALPTARPLLLLAPVPLAIFVAMRAQMPGTCLLSLVLGTMAIQLSLDGKGPFTQQDPRFTTVGVQLWMLGMATASLFLAALVEQRRTTMRALSASSVEVRELAGRLIVAQEQERARIARDLHDDINQRLAVASIRLSALRRKLGDSNRQDVSLLQNDLMGLSEDVRRISHDLHPSMLSQTGLTAALAGLCQSQRHRNGPEIDLRVSPQATDLSEDVSLCLYRVAQEALNNAIRHAAAQHIEVALDIGADHVDLSVADDGRGFETAERGRRGLGLMSIDERAKLLGGSYQLHSTPGKGTQLCICIPLGTSMQLQGHA